MFSLEFNDLPLYANTCRNVITLVYLISIILLYYKCFFSTVSLTETVQDLKLRVFGLIFLMNKIRRPVTIIFVELSPY